MDDLNQEDNEHTIKGIGFKGKTNEFKMWHKKFLARTNLKGYKSVLLGRINVPKHSEELSGSSDVVKKKIKVRKANNMAYSDLLLCVIDDVSFVIVSEAVTDDLPDGDASLAWKRLSEKYESKTGANMLQLKLAFATCCMEDVNGDPYIWISELEGIRQCL